MTDAQMWALLRSQAGAQRHIRGMPTSTGWYYFGSNDTARDAHTSTYFGDHADIVEVAWEIIEGAGDSAFENEAIWRMRAVASGDTDGDGSRITGIPSGKYAMIMYYAVSYDPIRGWSTYDWPYQRD